MMADTGLCGAEARHMITLAGLRLPVLHAAVCCHLAACLCLVCDRGFSWSHLLAGHKCASLSGWARGSMRQDCPTQQSDLAIKHAISTCDVHAWRAFPSASLLQPVDSVCQESDPQAAVPIRRLQYNAIDYVVEFESAVRRVRKLRSIFDDTSV